MSDQNVVNEKETGVENSGRRKAIKAVVGGVATVAAYNMLPAKWGTPLVESVFLPAHAAASGNAGGNNGNAGGNGGNNGGGQVNALSRESIVGAWRNNKNVIYNFRNDGSLIVGGETVTSTWTYANGHVLVNNGQTDYTVKNGSPLTMAAGSITLTKQ